MNLRDEKTRIENSRHSVYLSGPVHCPSEWNETTEIIGEKLVTREERARILEDLVKPRKD